MREDIQTKNKPYLAILQAGLLYVLLVLAHGYVFGHQDLIEITGYLNFLEDPTLYANDFYIQHITSRIPNERWMFVQLLNFFHIQTPWSFLIAHMVVSVIMLSGLILTGQEILQSRLFAFVAVLACMTVFYKINLGGNEIYYNTLTASLAAKTIGIWSIYFFLKNKPTTTLLMLIPASLIHPLVGIQLFLLIVGLIFVQQFQAGFSIDRLKKYWGIPVYLLTAGVWLYFLQKQVNDGNLSNETFYEIIEFRLAHHFIPSAFELGNYLILIPLFLFGTIYFWKKHKPLFWFFVFSILGLMVYSLGVEMLKSDLFLSTQWFKTTIWLKYFSLIAICGAVYELIKKHLPQALKWLNWALISALVALAVLLIWKLPERHPTTFDLPWKGDYNDEIAIARLAERKTPQDALFVTPIYFTHLKFYGKRSSYVDYKAMVHHKSVLSEWYQRVKTIYQIPNNLSSTQRLSSRHRQLPDSEEGIRLLKDLGITHIITDAPLNENTTLLGQKGKYFLYELK